MDTKKSAGEQSSPVACSASDCSECRHSCVEFPHSFLHADGRPFCVKGRPVTVLKLVQSERIQPGCMKPNAGGEGHGASPRTSPPLGSQSDSTGGK